MSSTGDIICFSHVGWDFVWQRPHHLMSRFARSQRVFYYEEPDLSHQAAFLHVRTCPSSGVTVVTPCRRPLPGLLAERIGEDMLARFLDSAGIGDFTAWYYTPMALRITSRVRPSVTVYDCMDELSSFAGAPPDLPRREDELLRRSDIVFTGGRRLFERKRARHPRVHLFPSSVDADHFRQARRQQPDPPDQAAVPRPRVGYCGVIDERCDLELLAGLAAARPEWQFVMIGPTAKVAPSDLPNAPNIHYLGPKPYKDLPSYLSGWDAAMIPFALNESTRYISPTKTPEYLAAGLPVVSTPIDDVQRPYGDEGLVYIESGVDGFAAALDCALARVARDGSWLERVDAMLKRTSWDATWSAMAALLPTRPERVNFTLTPAGFHHADYKR